jgi:hypothetical protein
MLMPFSAMIIAPFISNLQNPGFFRPWLYVKPESRWGQSFALGDVPESAQHIAPAHALKP